MIAAAVQRRLAPMQQQLAPVRRQLAPVKRRLAPVTRQLAPVKQRLAPVKKRLAPAKKRFTRLTKLVESWNTRVQRRIPSIPEVPAPVGWAALTVALAAWPSPGLVVGALALWRQVRVWRFSRKYAPSAALTRTTLITVLAAALGLRAQGAATVWVALTAGVAVVVSLAQGPLHQRVVPRIRAVNLPGVPSDPRSVEPGALVSVVPGTGVLLAALLILESIWELPSYAGGVVLLASLGLLARGGLRLRAAVLARRDGTADDDVAAALERFAPQFYVYFSGPVAGDYQLKMWLPYLEQLGVPFAILARSADMLPRAKALRTTAPLIACPAVTGLDVCMVPSVRAMFYVNINGSIADGVRYIDRTHVHLNHGDSDKPSSYHPIFAMFDRDFVAGPAAIERFARHGVSMPEEKFVVVGRPQVAGVADENTTPLAGRTTVLYAPTWQSGMREMSLSSLEQGERIVRTLIDSGARVIFRPHPLSAGQRQAVATIGRINEMLLADKQATGCPHWASTHALKEGMIANFNRSDALVSDVSSVASDYLASSKPMAVVLPTGTEAIADEEEYPVLRATYLIDLGADDLAAGFAPLVGAAEDSLEPVRHELRSYYLSDHEDSVAAFLAAAKSVLQDTSQSPSATA